MRATTAFISLQTFELMMFLNERQYRRAISLSKNPQIPMNFLPPAWSSEIELETFSLNSKSKCPSSLLVENEFYCFSLDIFFKHFLRIAPTQIECLISFQRL